MNKKLQKKYEQAKRKTSTILQSSGDDKIWNDETFWKEKWLLLVDREAELCEEINGDRS